MHRKSLSLAVKPDVITEYQLDVCKALDTVGLRMVYFEKLRQNQGMWKDSTPLG